MTMTGNPYGSYHFLTEILRQEWGFKGYVVSDSEAVEFISNKHKVADTYEDGIAQAGQCRTEYPYPFHSACRFYLASS